jgi:hypothetical protein
MTDRPTLPAVDFSKWSDAKLMNLLEWINGAPEAKWIRGLVYEIIRCRARDPSIAEVSQRLRAEIIAAQKFPPRHK